MPKSSKPAAASGFNRAYLLIGAVVLLAIVGYVFMSRGGSGAAAMDPVELTGEMANLQDAKGIPLGEATAPVTLVEFADFQCPACADFATFLHPLIKERLVDTGIVQLMRYDFPITSGHPFAFVAARAGRCAQELGDFWQFHDIVYGRQSSWSSQPNGPVEEMGDYAELAGIDRAQFDACLKSDRYADEVTRNMRLGESLGVSGTPTLMMNGQMLNARTFTELEAIVMEAAGRPVPPADTTAVATPPAG